MMRDYFYLALRLYLASQWLKSAVPKLRDPGWMSTGEEVKRFCERAILVPEPPARPQVSFEWYRDLLKAMTEGEMPRYLGRGLVLGQLVCGLGLLLGIQPRKAAAIGLVQNLSFALAGTSGHNPTMLLAEQILLLTSNDIARFGVEGWLDRR